MGPTLIYCDNHSCIKISKNHVFHNRSKHIDIWYHCLRDCVQRQIMLLWYIPIEEQDAEILTKALSKGKFKFHMCRIGVVYNPFLIERECWKMQQEILNLILPWLNWENLNFHISKQPGCILLVWHGLCHPLYLVNLSWRS